MRECMWVHRRDVLHNCRRKSKYSALALSRMGLYMCHERCIRAVFCIHHSLVQSIHHGKCTRQALDIYHLHNHYKQGCHNRLQSILLRHSSIPRLLTLRVRLGLLGLYKRMTHVRCIQAILCKYRSELPPTRFRKHNSQVRGILRLRNLLLHRSNLYPDKLVRNRGSPSLSFYCLHRSISIQIGK